MKGNAFVAWMLRSPLHRVMGNTMLITVTGRRSGRPITTPVNYFRSDDRLWVLTTRSRTWWRNVPVNPRVRLRLDGRDVTATADAVLEEAAVAQKLAEYVRRIPASARPLGIELRNGEPDPQDLLRLAGTRLFLAICPDTPTNAQ